MAQQQLTQIVTAAGSAVYPHIRSTEVFEGNDSGKFTCGIRMSKEDSDKLIARLEREWEMAKKTPELDGKRFGRNTQPSMGIREDNNGDIVFKAKTNAVIKTKAGEIINKKVTVFDKYGKPMPEDIEIGNGSTIKLCVLIRPFYASSSIYGLQILLKAVQVLNYVPVSAGGVSATDCGFEIEEQPKDDIDVPFTSDEGMDF